MLSRYPEVGSLLFGTINTPLLGMFRSELKGEKGGIGLENLKRRLAFIYPELYELNIFDQPPICKAELKIIKEP